MVYPQCDLRGPTCKGEGPHEKVQGLNGAYPLISHTLCVVTPEGAAGLTRKLHLQQAGGEAERYAGVLLARLCGLWAGGAQNSGMSTECSIGTEYSYGRWLYETSAAS